LFGLASTVSQKKRLKTALRVKTIHTRSLHFAGGSALRITLSKPKMHKHCGWHFHVQADIRLSGSLDKAPPRPQTLIKNTPPEAYQTSEDSDRAQKERVQRQLSQKRRQIFNGDSEVERKKTKKRRRKRIEKGGTTRGTDQLRSWICDLRETALVWEEEVC